MVRFIYIGAQMYILDEGEKEFCFWDTIRDEFINLGDNYVFTSVQHFTECWNDSDKNWDYNRLLGLINKHKVHYYQPKDEDEMTNGNNS